MSQFRKSIQCLYHITNCCLMFSSSWLEKPKQIRHQSSEALNCDLFCQSCENKGCIKCPASNVGWSDTCDQQGECCTVSVCLHKENITILISFFFEVFDVLSNERVDSQPICSAVLCLCLHSGPERFVGLQLFCWLHAHTHPTGLLLPDGILDTNIGEETAQSMDSILAVWLLRTSVTLEMKGSAAFNAALLEHSGVNKRSDRLHWNTGQLSSGSKADFKTVINCLLNCIGWDFMNLYDWISCCCHHEEGHGPLWRVSLEQKFWVQSLWGSWWKEH